MAKRTDIWADTGVESTEWAEREKFPDKVHTLPCRDAKAGAGEAKRHTDGPLEVSIW